MGGLTESGQEERLITSAHLPLVQLSHVATLTARDAGKYSQAVRTGRRGSGFGEHLAHPVLCSPGPSNRPTFLEFLGTTHCQNNKKRTLLPWGHLHYFLTVNTIPWASWHKWPCCPQIWLSQWVLQGGSSRQPSIRKGTSHRFRQMEELSLAECLQQVALSL